MNKINNRIGNQLDSMRFYQELDKYSQNPTVNTIASVLIAFLLVALAIKPSLAQISELRAEIDRLTQLNSSLETKLNILSKLKPLYEKALVKKDLFDACLPADPNVNDFEKQIRYYVQKNNLPFRSLSISSFPIIDSAEYAAKVAEKNENNNNPDKEIVPEIQYFSPLSFSLSLSGDYNGVKAFLYDFQKNIRALSAESINISQGDDSGQLTLSISGKVYYYKNQSL